MAGENDELTPADVQEALEKSARLILAIDAMADDLTYEGTKRLRVSSALFQISLEHHAAIHTLIDNSIIGSASALLRPQLEAYLRALWIAVCASEEQLESFCAGGQPPGIRKLAAQIEEAGVYEPGYLQSFLSERWTFLCDLTHGGAIQVASRMGAEGIQPINNVEIAFEILQQSVVFAGLACMDLPGTVGAIDITNVMNGVYERIYGPISPAQLPPP